MMLQCYSFRFFNCLDGGHFGLLASPFEQSLTLVPDPAPTQMTLQSRTSLDDTPVLDSLVTRMEGVLVILYLFIIFRQFFFRTLRGSHCCQESVGSDLTRFRVQLMCFWS